MAAIIGTDDGKTCPVPINGLQTGLLPSRKLPIHSVDVAEIGISRLPQLHHSLLWTLAPADSTTPAGSAKLKRLAEGEGRNAVFLALLGLDVLAVDGSDVGLAKAQALAASRGLAIQTEVADLTTYELPENSFGSVVSI